MDILTQGILGATVAQAGAPREESRVAAAIGFAAGMLADADILIQSAEDPLLNLDYHRHFTHALIFIPVGALIAALGLHPILKRRLSFARLYRYSLLGYMLSGLLDACTSYGTHLLWPFSDARIAWNLVSVIDPIFTGALVFGLAAAIYGRRTAFARAGIVFSALYLAFAFSQQSRALDAARELAKSRGHQIVESADPTSLAHPAKRAGDIDLQGEKHSARILTKPSFANTIVWRSVYVAEDRIYVDAIRVGLLTGPRIYQGESVPLFPAVVSRDARTSEPPTAAASPGKAIDIPGGSALARDIVRFRFFSDGYIGIHPDRPQILGDIRYSMLPDSALPMWGIAIDPTRADEHAEFRTFRKMTRKDRERFMGMVFGEE